MGNTNTNLQLVMTLDEAIDRAAELGKQIKRLEAERERLKGAIRADLQGRGVEHHETPGGHDALLYSRTTTSWNVEVLEELLTPEQLDRARMQTTNHGCLKVA